MGAKTSSMPSRTTPGLEELKLYRKQKIIALAQTIKIRKESRKRSGGKGARRRSENESENRKKGKQDVCDVVNQKLSGRGKAMDDIVGIQKLSTDKVENLHSM